MAGEYGFACIFSLMADWTKRLSGDKGIDFEFGGRTIDVKTARKPGNLIVERGKVIADIYVLAGLRDREVSFYGWEEKEVLLRAPVKDFGYGIENHYIPAQKLRHIFELLERVEKWRTP